MEKEELRDEDEGTTEVEIFHPDGVWIPRRLMTRVLPGFFGSDEEPTSKFSVTGTLPLVKSNSSGALVHGSIRYKATYMNSMAFCFSIGHATKLKTVSGYDSKWSIPFASKDLFARKMKEVIATELLDDWVAAHRGSGFYPNPSDRPRVVVEHGPVAYRESRKLILHQIDETTIEEIDKLFDGVAFLKPLAFKAEKEYRFVAKLKYGEKELEFPFRTALLPSYPFRELLK